MPLSFHRRELALSQDFFSWMDAAHPGTIIWDTQENDGATTALARNRVVSGVEDSALFPKSELLTQTNGIMDVGNWTAFNNATLSNPSPGVLRIARNGSNNPGAQQSILSSGNRYVVTAIADSDGNAAPRVLDQIVVMFSGTTASDQDIDFEWVTTSANPITFGALTSTGTEFVDFRLASVRQANPLNGSISGATVAQPFGGRIPYGYLFDGNNDFVANYSTALNTVFNGDEGAIFIFGNVANVGVWEDSTVRYLLRYRVDGANDMWIRRETVNNRITIRRRANNVNNETIIAMPTNTSNYLFGMSWSITNTEFITFVSGVGMSSAAMANNWAGALDPVRTLVGAGVTTGGNHWSGGLAAVGLSTVPRDLIFFSEIARRAGV